MCRMVGCHENQVDRRIIKHLLRSVRVVSAIPRAKGRCTIGVDVHCAADDVSEILLQVVADRGVGKVAAPDHSDVRVSRRNSYGWRLGVRRMEVVLPSNLHKSAPRTVQTYIPQALLHLE